MRTLLLELAAHKDAEARARAGLAIDQVDHAYRFAERAAPANPKLPSERARIDKLRRKSQTGSYVLVREIHKEASSLRTAMLKWVRATLTEGLEAVHAKQRRLQENVASEVARLKTQTASLEREREQLGHKSAPELGGAGCVVMGVVWFAIMFVTTASTAKSFSGVVRVVWALSFLVVPPILTLLASGVIHLIVTGIPRAGLAANIRSHEAQMFAVQQSHKKVLDEYIAANANAVQQTETLVRECDAMLATSIA